MRADGISSMDPATREIGFTEVETFLDGIVEPLFTEEFKNMNFSELVKDVNDKDLAATQDPTNMRKRMELIYAMALLRDAVYSHSGSKFMKALGANDLFRLLYEGGKVYMDAAKT